MVLLVASGLYVIWTASSVQSKQFWSWVLVAIVTIVTTVSFWMATKVESRFAENPQDISVVVAQTATECLPWLAAARDRHYRRHGTLEASAPAHRSAQVGTGPGLQYPGVLFGIAKSPLSF